MSDEARKRLDCGDNSCEFDGRGQGGMRTNGGCSCLEDLSFKKRMAVRGYIRDLLDSEARLKAEVERLKDPCAQAGYHVCGSARADTRVLELEAELATARERERELIRLHRWAVTPRPKE